MVGVATLFYKDTTDFSFRLLRWGPDFAIITVALESKGCFKSREFAPMRLHIQGQQRKSGWLVACSLAGYGNIIYYEVMKYRMRWISKPHHRYRTPLLCAPVIMLIKFVPRQLPPYETDYRLANPAFLPPRPNRMLGGTNCNADIELARSSIATSGFWLGLVGLSVVA